MDIGRYCNVSPQRNRIIELRRNVQKPDDVAIFEFCLESRSRKLELCSTSCQPVIDAVDKSLLALRSCGQATGVNKHLA